MNRNEHTNPAGGVMKGALIGMTIGAAAVVLSKKENRRKLQRTVNDLLEMGEDKMDSMNEKFEDLKSQGRERLSQAASRVSDNLEKASDEVEKRGKAVSRK